MKIPIGYAKNEAFELIFGNILIGLGGFFVGLAYSNQDLFALIYPAIVIFGFGILFDVRVLRRFSYELEIVKIEIRNAKADLDGTRKDLEHTKDELKIEERNIREIISKLGQTKKELEQTERKMKEAEDKIFGFRGVRSSRSSYGHSIDDEVDKLKKIVSDLQSKVKEMERNQGYRRY